MQRINDRLVFSPSDLNHFLECEHLIQLERQRDPHAPRAPRDAHADLLAEKGAEHELAWLNRFRADGKTIVTIESAGRDRDWAADAECTARAMRAGADVIYQAVFADDQWHGVSDFLVRVERPSMLGDWSYEAWDTKLARHTKPYFVLQLVFYTEQLERIQTVVPEGMVVVLGTGEHDRLLYRDFDAYYRSVRRRFVEAASADRESYPYPVAHCRMCEHEADCEHRWAEDDHLSGVAGIRRDQVQRLNEAGIRTSEELSTIDTTKRIGIGASTLEKLRHQAALQTGHRNTGVHRCDLLPVDERTGFRLLPESSSGDVFFDMEGDPYFAPERGLEYLFGFMTIDGARPEFRACQALDRDQEKVAFEQFIDFLCTRLAQWPDLHVYHYAAYETSALKRLMAEHATREDELDDLLRREVFVDLYQVVRQSIRISHPSYSIKKVRTFFMEGAGQGAVTKGGDSILEFERWRRTGDAAILQAITDYNEEDCLSTLKLRDWLIAQKAEAERTSGVAVPWKTTKPYEETEKRAEEDALTALRRERLQALGTPDALLLAELLNYHRREAKPEWWAYFDRQKKSLDDLIDDTEAIAYLRPVEGVKPEKVKQSLVYTLEFPDQEFKLGPDPKAQVEDPFLREAVGTIAWLDSAARRLGLKRGFKRSEEPLPSALVCGKPIDDKAQRQAIGRVADGHYSAILDILRAAPPRVIGRAPGSSLQTLDLAEQQSLVASLDNSYLFIQGPPGSGKTWTGARLIVSLIAAGKRVGVAANSHKAINNLLAGVESVARDEHLVFTGIKRCSDEDDGFEGTQIVNVFEAKECDASDASLIGGTAWQFSREAMDGRLDCLFIDEAGQVSLADTVAMGTAARNLVLLGDPQQLPQVRQGIHPGESGRSVLEHLLAGRATVPEDRGVFLDRTWRMHPDVCAFISQLSYEARLRSAEGRDRQRITSPGLDGAGLRFLPVEHAGNAQASVEEANAVAVAVRGLLAGGTFTDVDGQVRKLTVRDILVVAPYNMQVRCLREALPAGIEVGTVDKFQGREAPVVVFSMASSSGEDVPRGLEFLFSRNRFNVAISRAKALAVLVCSPRLLDVPCRKVDQIRLVNSLCRFAENASAQSDQVRALAPR
ncbi:MAG TPA: TM0106 family RecB-like putative nuclease [Vicinamibacterales bacterium]|nr:TM0106 family RecB-like putative nuclease [Vicinamibacterales bacterium]